MVNLAVRHQEQEDQGDDEAALVEMSIRCEAVNLVADGIVVKPINPATCRSGTGQTHPTAYLNFTLPSAEPQKITCFHRVL